MPDCIYIHGEESELTNRFTNSLQCQAFQSSYDGVDIIQPAPDYENDTSTDPFQSFIKDMESHQFVSSHIEHTTHMQLLLIIIVTLCLTELFIQYRGYLYRCMKYMSSNKTFIHYCKRFIL